MSTRSQVQELLRLGEVQLERANPAQARAAFDQALLLLPALEGSRLLAAYARARRGAANLALRQLAAARADLEAALEETEGNTNSGSVPADSKPTVEALRSHEGEDSARFWQLVKGLSWGDLGQLESIVDQRRTHALQLLERGADLLEELGADLRAGHVRRWLAVARTIAESPALADLESARALSCYRRLGPTGDYWIAVTKSMAAKRKSDLGQYEQALQLLDEGLKVLDPAIPSHFLDWSRAIVLERLGKPDAAFEALRSAYDQVERAASRTASVPVAQARLMAHPARIGDHLALRLLERDRIHEAIAVYTRVQDWQTTSQAMAWSGVSPELEAAYAAKRQALDALEDEVPLLERNRPIFREQRRTLLNDLEQLELSLCASQTPAQPHQLADVVGTFGPAALAQPLGPSTALLSYYQPSKGPLRCIAITTDERGELDRSEVLTISPSRPAEQAADELDRLLAESQAALLAGQPQSARSLFEGGVGGSALELIYRDYLEPAEELFKQAKQLVLSTSGPMTRLPFHLARTSTGYLQDQRSVSYLPTPALLAQRTEGSSAPGATPKSPALFVVLDDVSGEAALAEVIDGLQRFENSGLLQGAVFATANRLVADLGRIQVLYLGGHAAPEPEFPGLGYFALSNDQGRSTRLTVSDVARLPLHPDCVAILSGCSTAWSEPTTRSSGLAAACLQAGARACVGSMWPVSQLFVQKLMPRLWEALLTEPPHEAIRAAVRSLREEDPTCAAVPVWGGFVSTFPLGRIRGL